MNSQLDRALNRIDGLDLIEVDLGISSINLVYLYSDLVESKVRLCFNDIVYLRYFGDVASNEGSLYIGQSSLLDIDDFLNKSKDMEIKKHIKKLITKGLELKYFNIEGEIYMDIVCEKISCESKGSE